MLRTAAIPPVYGDPVMPEQRTPPPVSDEQVIRRLTTITVGFCGALVAIGALGAFVLVPDPTVSVPGLALGLVLGLVSWFGSQWVTSRAIDRVRRPGARPVDASASVGTVAFLGVAFAEVPALVTLPLAILDGSDVGPVLVAVPIAIAAVLLHGTGPGAVRRHLDRLRG